MTNKTKQLIRFLWPVCLSLLLASCSFNCHCCQSWIQSIASGFMVYWLTVSLPEYHYSCHKIEYIKPRAKMIVQVGITLFNNIQNKYSQQLPTESDIEQACSELDLLKSPIIYPIFGNEHPSWDLLLSKCITDLINPTQELVVICDKTDLGLLNACSKIKDKLYQLRFEIGVHLGARDYRQDRIRGTHVQTELIELIKLWRQVERYA